MRDERNDVEKFVDALDSMAEIFKSPPQDPAGTWDQPFKSIASRPDDLDPSPTRRLPGMAGKQALGRFANGYGVSIVQHAGSYGGRENKWELAVLKWEPGADDFELTYDTPITDDVIGWLTWDEAVDIAREVEALTSEESK